MCEPCVLHHHHTTTVSTAQVKEAPVEHALRSGVEMPDELHEQGVTITQTERRGITLRQLHLVSTFIESVLLAVAHIERSEYSSVSSGP